MGVAGYRIFLGVVLALAFSGCGGGGSGSVAGIADSVSGGNSSPPPSDFESGVFRSSDDFAAMCENPRAGNFPDQQGSAVDENNWLRSWSNELYLWYDEIVDRDPEAYDDPLAYFELMKTEATTASGAPKDKFHFTYDTEEWELLSQSGISAGYGAEVVILSATPPREIVVAFSNPNTPAADANLFRGARILEVDGVDVVLADGDAEVDALNAGFFPSTVGEQHTFVVQDLGSTATRSITMTAAEVTEDPVQFEQVLNTPDGPVGYLFFSSHISTAEEQLVSAFLGFQAAGVTELVLDLRYNGGGFLDIAAEVGYMIAGADASGQTFEVLQFNDKNPNTNPVTGQPLTPTPFHQTTQGFSLASGQSLPTLNLDRVFVLTSADTCSASEAIINGLRGINVDVVQIGDTTCGKPYGFYAFDNCGTTYFSIQFRGVNAQNFGDYSDGFSPLQGALTQGESVPGCYVADDFDSVLSDPDEAQLAAALSYIDTGSCPAAPTGGLVSRRLEQRSAPSAPGARLEAPWRPGRVLR